MPLAGLDRPRHACNDGCGAQPIVLPPIGVPSRAVHSMSPVPAAVAIALLALLVVRTRWEDRLLQTELPGYADYARRTPYRLLPGVW
jgi:hypothetical protein